MNYQSDAGGVIDVLAGDKPVKTQVELTIAKDGVKNLVIGIVVTILVTILIKKFS